MREHKAYAIITTAYAFALPIYDFINDFPLLCGGLPQVNPGGFDALVSHQIGEKGNVVTTLKKALCEAMTERMGVDHCRVNVITNSQLLQLTGNTSGRDTVAILVQKNEAALLVFVFQPGKGFFLESLGDVNPPQLSSLGVQVQIPQLDVLDLELNQFAYSGTGGGQESDNEVPE